MYHKRFSARKEVDTVTDPQIPMVVRLYVILLLEAKTTKYRPQKDCECRFARGLLLFSERRKKSAVFVIRTVMASVKKRSCAMPLFRNCNKKYTVDGFGVGTEVGGLFVNVCRKQQLVPHKQLLANFMFTNVFLQFS